MVLELQNGSLLHKLFVVDSARSFILQEIHAPFLGIWVVKLVVLAVFVAFSLASIVSISHSLF